MSISLYLLLGHLVADFPLQGDYIAKNKGSNFLIMLVHVYLYTLLLSAIYNFFGLFNSTVLYVLATSHLIIDTIKCTATQHGWGNEVKNLWLDQIAHIVIINGLTFYLLSTKM